MGTLLLKTPIEELSVGASSSATVTAVAIALLAKPQCTCDAIDYVSGHGTRIKNALIELCKELRYHHLVAKIFADNTASIEYNLRMGYEMVGIQKQIGFRRGRFQDIAILQLVLDDVPPEIPPHLLDDQAPET